MASKESGVAASSIARDLKGIDFPANKQALVEQARSNNAGDPTISELESMPDQEYESMADVTQAMKQAQRGSTSSGDRKPRDRQG